MRGKIYFLFFIFIFLSSCTAGYSSLPGKLNHPLTCILPSELSGFEKVKVIGIFTTWSLKSQIQLQRFRKLKPLFAKYKVAFYVVLTDPNQKMVEDWIAVYKPSFPVLYAPKFKVCSLKIKSVPTIIIYKNRKIYYFYSGLSETKILYDQIMEVLDK